MRTPEEAFFFAGKPKEEGLYEQLMAMMETRLPAFQLRVQKTQITFANPKVFACVSLKWKDCIVVTFGLPDKVDSLRIHQASEIRPGRWTHHVRVRSADELDDELMGWIGAAYAFASGEWGTSAR